MDKLLALAGNILLAVFCVLLFLIVLVAVICVSHPKIIIKYKTSPEISASLWFLRFNITKFLSRQKKNKKPKMLHFDGTHFGALPKDAATDKKKEAEPKKAPKAASAYSSKKEKKPISETVSEITELITDILTDISEPLKKILTVHIKRLYITAASEDAHKTALLFGHANTATGCVIYACRKFAALSIDEDGVGVYSDFNASKASVDAHIVLTLSLRHILSCAFKAFMRFIKRKA